MVLFRCANLFHSFNFLFKIWKPVLNRTTGDVDGNERIREIILLIYKIEKVERK